MLGLPWRSDAKLHVWLWILCGLQSSYLALPATILSLFLILLWYLGLRCSRLQDVVDCQGPCLSGTTGIFFLSFCPGNLNIIVTIHPPNMWQYTCRSYSARAPACRESEPSDQLCLASPTHEAPSHQQDLILL